MVTLNFESEVTQNNGSVMVTLKAEPGDPARTVVTVAVTGTVGVQGAALAGGVGFVGAWTGRAVVRA